MFTGIIEERGKIKSRSHSGATYQLSINCLKVLSDTKKGDSIAVNGVCLTVIGLGNDWFSADVSPETLTKSSLNFLNTGEVVNLERAMSANGRFGGHIVSGHVDGLGEIQSIKPLGNSMIFKIKIPGNLLKYAIKHGSISIDGISLTIADLEKDFAKLAIIPETVEQTNLRYKAAGDKVNVEMDLIGKYIERLYLFEDKAENKESKINRQFLMEKGFFA
ncbi:MAG: riboflavin synthase [Spirochaetales bacterium]|nr:riboflavin synthase [Spirochaetales bacterium]